MATIAALLAGVIVVAAHQVGLTFGQTTDNSPWTYAFGFARFLCSALGLLVLYVLSARETQAELHQFRRMLSVCAWCRKIKDHGGWLTLESYMARRVQTDLTHGICPSCLDTRYTEDQEPPTPPLLDGRGGTSSVRS